jgi:hypothetical protein
MFDLLDDPLCRSEARASSARLPKAKIAHPSPYVRNYTPVEWREPTDDPRPDEPQKPVNDGTVSALSGRATQRSGQRDLIGNGMMMES